jgi:hypothetical protein
MGGLLTSLFSQELKFGVEGRAALLNGVETLAKAVATTLGPKGRNVLIESSFGSPKITKGSPRPPLLLTHPLGTWKGATG